jgi:hypothetical protein
MMQVSFSGMSVGVGSCATTFVLASVQARANVTCRTKLNPLRFVVCDVRSCAKQMLQRFCKMGRMLLIMVLFSILFVMLFYDVRWLFACKAESHSKVTFWADGHGMRKGCLLVAEASRACCHFFAACKVC